MEWNRTDIILPEEGKIIDTKVEDFSGGHNFQKLKLVGKLWFEPDGSMYVYYTPTHWRNPLN